ncbi:MAG: hypothetical protein ACRC2S_16815 [Waterburya sp.]
MWLIVPWLEVFPNHHLLLGFHKLIALMNQFLQAKQEQDNEDIQDARAALATVDIEGTVTWDELKTEVGL